VAHPLDRVQAQMDLLDVTAAAVNFASIRFSMEPSGSGGIHPFQNESLAPILGHASCTTYLQKQ
jgi:hypothetical protein